MKNMHIRGYLPSQADIGGDPRLRLRGDFGSGGSLTFTGEIKDFHETLKESCDRLPVVVGNYAR